MTRLKMNKNKGLFGMLLILSLLISQLFSVAVIDTNVCAAETLPIKYDGRVYQTPIRDQGRSELCWAYSTIAALEANAVKTLGADKNTLDFSEYHLAYFTFANKQDPLGLTNKDTITFHTLDAENNYIKNGGNPGYPVSTLTSGAGPVLESVVSTDTIFEASGEVKEGAYGFTIDEALRMGKNAYDVNGVYSFLINNSTYDNNANRSKIKSAIQKYGAVATAYYSSEAKKYYNKTADSQIAYYQNTAKTFDHGVAIVGWDDDFSKDNFYSSNKPKNNGAWLVKNSWGQTGDSQGYTKDGYFWLSYEDASFTPIDKGGDKNFAYCYELRETGKYKYTYQYDGGLNHELNTLGNLSTDNVYYANIFTAQNDQRLEAITIHTDQGQETAPCKITVYTDVVNNPDDGKKVLEQNVSINGNGFHTIPLEHSIDINKNQKFSVVVFTDQYTYIASDRDYNPEGSKFSVYNHTDPSQSFVKNYYSSYWIDLDNERSYTFEDGASLCIKALMNDQDQESSGGNQEINPPEENPGGNLDSNPTEEPPGDNQNTTVPDKNQESSPAEKNEGVSHKIDANDNVEPQKGETITDEKTGIVAEVLDVKKKEVSYVGPESKSQKSITIPPTVIINNISYKVTKVEDNAFEGNKNITTVKLPKTIVSIGKRAFKGATKLKSVTLPAKTTVIGAEAFKGCKNLKTITIKSTKLKSKNISKKAFSGITKKTTIKVPKKQLKAYKKLFKNKGLSSKVKVK